MLSSSRCRAGRKDLLSERPCRQARPHSGRELPRWASNGPAVTFAGSTGAQGRGLPMLGSGRLSFSTRSMLEESVFRVLAASAWLGSERLDRLGERLGRAMTVGPLLFPCSLPSMAYAPWPVTWPTSGRQRMADGVCSGPPLSDVPVAVPKRAGHVKACPGRAPKSAPERPVEELGRASRADWKRPGRTAGKSRERIGSVRKNVRKRNRGCRNAPERAVRKLAPKSWKCGA